MKRPPGPLVRPAAGRDAPVRQASLREHNLALVLRQVATASNPPSRADVAAATGLTRATVSTLIDELVGGGLVAELEPVPRSGAGRPPTGLVLAPTGPCGLGLEINVDYLAALVMDLTGTIRHREVIHADQRTEPPAAALANLTDLAARARAAAEGAGLRVAGAALAVPGMVDASGLVRLAPNLGWHDLAVPLALRAALGEVPLTVENEANLAALGELGASTEKDFLYLSGEIGIGAGIVLHGELFRGARGWSGEVGHLTVQPDGPPCRCGARGCLEQYASQEAILRDAGHPVPVVPAAAAVDIIAGRAREGDPAMLAALSRAATTLGVAIAGVVNVLDLDTVILGGNYAPLTPWLAEDVRRELATRVVTAAWAPIQVRAGVLGTEATVVGAADSVVRTVRESPSRWLTP